MVSKKTVSYSDLRQELDDILAKLNNPELDIDIMLSHHKRAEEVIKDLEHYLKRAENTVKKIKQNKYGA